MVSRLLAKAPALSATAVSLFAFMAIAFADTADDNWTSFRQAVPAHLQTLALSEPDKTGLRTLIISEPPPDTLPKSQYVLRLRGIFGDHFRTARILRKETGLHGWVEDIVVGIGGYASGGNDPEMRDDLALLAETLWGTSYKMAPLALPAPRSREVSPEVPDIAIRQSELRDWLLDGKVRLSPVSAPAAPPRALMELAAAGTMGAFLSNDQRGLTVLLIDRRQPFETNRVEFRKFALDTDLVVGAVSIGSDYLAFVGRERQASVTTVPPLRFETALLLVTSKRAELSQSYERTQIFAGQLQSGKFKGWDWAPIYLSPELVDTELGSVLNFTDQMLKSWSAGGIVKYLYFGYPVPAQFPFPHPIMDEVRHIEPKVDSILFNWNTTGAFSLVDYQPTTTKPKSATLAVLHSGSLPMVYRDEERPIFDQIFNPFEAKGYEYFRNLKEPLLARVTSYQVFFQATRDHPLSTNENVPSITVGIPRDVVAATGQLLQHAHDWLAKLNSEDIDTECKRLSSIGVADSEEDCQDAVEARTIALAIFAAAPDPVKQRIAAFVIDPKSMPQISDADHKRAVEAVKASLKGLRRTSTIPSQNCRRICS